MGDVVWAPMRRLPVYSAIPIAVRAFVPTAAVYGVSAIQAPSYISAQYCAKQRASSRGGELALTATKLGATITTKGATENHAPHAFVLC